MKSKMSRVTTTVLLLLVLMSSSLYAGQTVTTLKLCAGTKYETPYYIVKSSVAGPVVMITAGVHGNETSPITAADQMRKWTIKKGTLIVVPSCNAIAIKNGKRESPDGDLNRAFPMTSKEKASSPVATALLEVINKYKVEWLMDMHEGANYAKTSDSVGNSIIYMPGTKGSEAFAKKLLPELNSSISNKNKQFVLLKYPAKNSLARSAAELYDVRSFILETCTKDSTDSRIASERAAAVQLMKYVGMK